MDIVVVAVALVLTGLLGGQFFGPRETRRAAATHSECRSSTRPTPSSPGRSRPQTSQCS